MQIYIDKDILTTSGKDLSQIDGGKPSLYKHGMKTAMLIFGNKISDHPAKDIELVYPDKDLYAELLVNNKGFRDGFLKLLK